MKPQPINADYIFFLDDLELYQLEPYKMIGSAEMISKLSVKTWTRVNVATGEDVNELVKANVPVSLKDKWFAVGGSFPKDHAYPAIIGTRVF